MNSLFPSLPDSAKCYGCSACYAAYPISAILMRSEQRKRWIFSFCGIGEDLAYMQCKLQIYLRKRNSFVC